MGRGKRFNHYPYQGLRRARRNTKKEGIETRRSPGTLERGEPHDVRRQGMWVHAVGRTSRPKGTRSRYAFPYTLSAPPRRGLRLATTSLLPSQGPSASFRGSTTLRGHVVCPYVASRQPPRATTKTIRFTRARARQICIAQAQNKWDCRIGKVEGRGACDIHHLIARCGLGRMDLLLLRRRGIAAPGISNQFPAIYLQ